MLDMLDVLKSRVYSVFVKFIGERYDLYNEDLRDAFLDVGKAVFKLYIVDMISRDESIEMDKYITELYEKVLSTLVF